MEESEKVIQQYILDNIGEQEMLCTKTKAGKVRWEGSGLYCSESTIAWRVNSGKAKSLFGGMITLAPKGTADIIGIRDGVPFAIEVKSAVGKQSSEQKEWAKKWQDRGGRYYLVAGMERAEEFIKEWRESCMNS